jgi:hypothetical protein
MVHVRANSDVYRVARGTAADSSNSPPVLECTLDGAGKAFLNEKNCIDKIAFTGSVRSD